MDTCCTHLGLTNSMIEKIIPVVISTIFVVLLFIIGRILDVYIKSKEIKRNWYQKVIIDPNISKVNTFYLNILEQANLSVQYLVANAGMAHNEYLRAKIDEMEKFKVIKRGYEFGFIMMVQANYPEIACELSEHLRDVEDGVTTCLDKNNLAVSDFDELESKLISQKHCIYRILYKPLVYKRPRLRNLLKKKTRLN